MTYEKAHDYFRGRGGSINDLTDGQSRAAKAIWRLQDRSGFVHWWHEIGERNRDEIFTELSEDLE